MLRNTDEAAADVVTRFLEQYFYFPYTANYQYHRNTALQSQGLDTTFVWNGRHYACDEKAAVRYINKKLWSFSMELSFIDAANVCKDGWLLDEGKRNDSFLFVWLDQADVPSARYMARPDQLRDVEYALVRRERIIEYLASLGWTLDKLRRKTERLRQYLTESTGNLWKDGCKFTVSRQLVEQPVNVLIPRNKLIEMSDCTMHLQF